MQSPEAMEIEQAASSVRPKSLSGVLVSVGYGEYLTSNLSQNVGLFDELIVVTTSEDVLTQNLAQRHGAKLVISDRCYDQDHSFNKGRMLNDGLAALKDPDWVLLTDADITLNSRTRELLFANAWNPSCLYYTRRIDRSPVANQPDKVNMEPNGYFQLFNRRGLALRDRWPSLMCEEFCSAGAIDTWFCQQFPDSNRIAVPDFEVEHDPSLWLGQNWNGRAERLGTWRQLGILTTAGFATFLKDMTTLPAILKLTDTLYGQSAIIETAQINSYVRILPSGLEFLGHELGHSHIHVAYKS